MKKLEIAIYMWGPSGSGKTYTLMKLQDFLQELGFTTSDVIDGPTFNLPHVHKEGLLAEKNVK